MAKTYVELQLFMTTISFWTWLVLALFALLTCLHALSLKRIIPWSFGTHLKVMRFLWNLWNASVVALVVTLPRTISLSTSVRAVGVVLLLVGLGISTWHRLLLGRERFMGGRCFDRKYDTRVAGGLYQYLKNPIYDGIIIAFIGLTLWRQNMDFLLLAASSFLFLNLFMARIEGVPPSSHSHIPLSPS